MLKKSGISCIFALAAAVVLAAAPAQAAAAATRADGDQISVYPAAFFADARPATASDMVARLPGFTLNTGLTTVRGFAG
jgi:hypothetical protein